jgi:Putative amidoligase enzyme
MEGFQEMVSRLKKKYPMLHYFTDRSFGVEIEFYGLDYYILPPDNGIIKPYNVHSKARDGRSFLQLLDDCRLSLGTGQNSWHLEEDSSIVHRGGVELISPILRGFEGLVESYRFFQLLGEISGAQIDESCGFHVHHGVDAEWYKCTNLKELVKIVYAMEDYLYLLISGGRRYKETCRPMDLDMKSFLDLAACEDGRRSGCGNCENGCGNGCRIKEMWYSPENRYDADSNRSERYDMTRYHGLNLHSYWYRSTIEFRYHTAVLRRIDEAMQWIIFTQFLVELSEGHIPLIEYQANANKWMKTICKIYLAFGHMNRINGWRTKNPL